MVSPIIRRLSLALMGDGLRTQAVMRISPSMLAVLVPVAFRLRSPAGDVENAAVLQVPPCARKSALFAVMHLDHVFRAKAIEFLGRPGARQALRLDKSVAHCLT